MTKAAAAPAPPALIRELGLRNLLSFGPASAALPLNPLNVLVGPNGSGKSNVVEALAALRAAPRDLHQAIRRGGGIQDWLWQGKSRAVEAGITLKFAGRPQVPSEQQTLLSYHLNFGAAGGVFEVTGETLAGEPGGIRYLTRERDRLILASSDTEERSIGLADIDPTQSILSQRRDPDLYPEMSWLAEILSRVRIYRSFQFGPEAVLRSSCRTDVRTDYLEEALDNLPARLAAIKRNPATKRRLLELLGDLAPSFDDLEIVPEGGALQLYLIEGERSVPAHRLSDGTLRYLCLLAILLDPGPTSLLVIEEPELGLHPDVVSSLCKLLIETSQRTQLLVTTHSTQLLDGLTEHAESVLICEKPEDRTHITRLRQSDIDPLKHQGGLGWLWMRGHLGGTRW